MGKEQFNALYAVWKDLAVSDYAFFVRMATCSYLASLRFLACEYCTQECLKTSEATLLAFTSSLLDQLAHESVKDRVEHLLELLELLLCKLSVLVESCLVPHTQSRWKTFYSITLSSSLSTLFINNKACKLAPSLPLFLSFPSLFASHTISSRFPLLYSISGRHKTLVRPWYAPNAVHAACRLETKELPVNEKDYEWLEKEQRSPEFLSFFGIRMVRQLMELQKSPVFSDFEDEMRRLVLELPLLEEEPFVSFMKKQGKKQRVMCRSALSEADVTTLWDTEDEVLMLCGLCFLDCLCSFEKGVLPCTVRVTAWPDRQESILRTLITLFSRLHARHFLSFIGPLYSFFASAVNYIAIPTDFASAAVTPAFATDCMAAVLGVLSCHQV